MVACLIIQRQNGKKHLGPSLLDPGRRLEYVAPPLARALLSQLSDLKFDPIGEIQVFPVIIFPQNCFLP